MQAWPGGCSTICSWPALEQRNVDGAIHVDGQGALITSQWVLFNPTRSPGFSKAEIQALFAAGWMTEGHVDGVYAFVRPGVPLVEATRDPHSDYARCCGRAAGRWSWLEMPKATGLS